MNYQLILEDLEKWQDDEILYRDAHFVKEGKLTKKAFLEAYQSDSVTLELALHPESIETHLKEDSFISLGRNISIIKHPRYLPLFFHEHEFFEINYVLSGNYIQHFGDRSVSLTQGDFCLLAPHARHGLEVFNDSIVLNILIRYSTFLDIFINTVRDKTQLSQFFMNNFYSQKKLRYMLFHTQNDVVIRNYILDMYLEQLQSDQYSDRIICSLMTIFFTQLMRRHGKTIEIPEMQNTKKDPSNEIMNYILNHYAHISIQQIAEHFHYSRQYCSKLIREVTGYSFSDLLTDIRLKQGIVLLCNTSLSISQISERLGYQNPETFVRVFKKYQNVTPAQYRRNTFKIDHNSSTVTDLQTGKENPQ